MKTLRLHLATAAALAATATLLVPAEARAGQKEWATAGQILTGVVAADLLFNHLPRWGGERETVEVRQPVYYPQPQVMYAPPPVIMAPAPVAVYAPPPPPAGPAYGAVWHEGHYEYRPRQEWVDSSYEQEEWIPPQRLPNGVWVDGHRIRRPVNAGYWRTIEEKVWVQGGFY